MTHARLLRKAPPSFSLDVDLPIGPGVTALLGPAGAGKSLVLDLIAGFAVPDSGRILIEDAIVFDGGTGVNLPPRRRHAAHVTSHDTLFPHLSVRDNLMFAAANWTRLERHKRVAEITQHFGLDDTALSRTAARIARAILSEPRLLLIDECRMDEDLLRLTTSAFHGPILMVSADLELCYACAAELVLLEAGRILQRGPARETIDAPTSLAAAALLGFDNTFPASISALDPGRNSSRLECERFTLTGPYLPGHFNGDRVHIAVRARDVRVHSGEIAPMFNSTPLPLMSISERLHSVRLIFDGGVAAELSRDDWERQRNNKRWQVEFPATALRVL
jgi:ABC-type sulfate/molybdate transport systems ATPase subunit